MNDRSHQIKLSSFEEETQRLKLKHKEDLKDQELIASRDLQRVKEAHTSAEQTWKEQMVKLENIRTALERVVMRLKYIVLTFSANAFQEINSLKSTVSTQKLAHEEALQQEKTRIKHEEEKKQQEIEDRLRALTSAKEELEVVLLFSETLSLRMTRGRI